jgi:hypothetical protein
MPMELAAGGLIWRIVFAVVAVVAVVISRRPTFAQRITEALGIVALFGMAWVLIVGFDLHALTAFVVAAAAAFGLLSAAETRR